jgi:hypothetical protein
MLGDVVAIGIGLEGVVDDHVVIVAALIFPSMAAGGILEF